MKYLLKKSMERKELLEEMKYKTVKSQHYDVISIVKKIECHPACFVWEEERNKKKPKIK